MSHTDAKTNPISSLRRGGQVEAISPTLTLRLLLRWLALAPARPNFIFILADDLGWGDPGCSGNTFRHPPKLDRLASPGKPLTDLHWLFRR